MDPAAPAVLTDPRTATPLSGAPASDTFRCGNHWGEPFHGLGRMAKDKNLHAREPEVCEASQSLDELVN
jgi:hypothetical protein